MQKDPFPNPTKDEVWQVLEFATAVFGLVQSFRPEITIACKIVVVICLVILAFASIKRK